MKFLQISDLWLRRVLAQWLAQQKAPDFALADKAEVALEQEKTDLILSAGDHEVGRYAVPVRLAELVADIGWLMARRGEAAAREIILGGAYILEPYDFCLRCGDRAAQLTGREVALLQFLAEAGESSKEKLLEKVWRYHPESDTHTVETHLWRLRQKLQQAGMAAPLIVTTDNGYRLA